MAYGRSIPLSSVGSIFTIQDYVFRNRSSQLSQIVRFCEMDLNNINELNVLSPPSYDSLSSAVDYAEGTMATSFAKEVVEAYINHQQIEQNPGQGLSI